MSVEDLQGADGGETVDLDLRGELAAALEASEASQGSDAGAGPSPALSAQPGERPAPAPATEQKGIAPQVGPQPARDEQGRFAKQDAPANQQPEPKTPAAGAEAGQAQPIAPPATWSAAAKAKFASLDPELQQEVLRRERDMEQGRAQWQQGAERLNRLTAILDPRRDRFALAGVDEARAVQALFAAQDLLERDPVSGLLYLGRQYGVNWPQLFQSMQQGGPAQPAQLAPGMEPLVRQVQSLTQTVQQQQAQQRQAAQAGYANQVASFAADPKNIYFENVRARMGELIRIGQAKDLADAYDQACWSDPAVRPLMIAASEQQRQTDEKAAAAQRVAAARQASGSVTGSPRPGGPGNGGPAPTLREELSRNYDAFAA